MDASTKLSIHDCRSCSSGFNFVDCIILANSSVWHVVCRDIYVDYERFRELFQLSTRLSHHYRPFIVEHQYRPARVVPNGTG